MTSADRGACRHKLVLSTMDREQAMHTAATLGELIDPPADAVAVFEVPSADPASPPQHWRVDAYYIERPDADDLAQSIAALTGIAAPRLVLEAVPDENWVALSQTALPPVAAGRFTIHGSHDRDRVVRGPWTIQIDAGEAFGTAHHATTYGCLMAIDRLTRRRASKRVLDLGCGTGVLAIAARRVLPRASVRASDVDPVAVAVTKANVRANTAHSIEAIVSDGVPRASQHRRAGYDLLVANILARPLTLLAGPIARSVCRGGIIVLSGLLNGQAREVRAAYLSRGFSLQRHERIAGWSTLTLVKR